MNKLCRAYCAVRMSVKSILSRGAIKFTDPMHTYRVSADAKIKAQGGGSIFLGSCSTETNVHLVAWSGKLTIERGCTFNRNVIVVARKQITIRSNTKIGPNVCIYDHDHAFGPEGIISREYKMDTIDIGSNVWIGAGTIILRGTTIGDNSVIGAGCVITGEIPKNTLVTSENRNLKIERLHKKQDETSTM